MNEAIIFVVIVVVFIVISIARKSISVAGQIVNDVSNYRKKKASNYSNPEGKSLEWFSSEDGINAFNEYITVQNYLLQENLEKVYEDRSTHDCDDFYVFARVFYEDAKLPYVFFANLVREIDSLTLIYNATKDMLIDILLIQAKPFYIDEDGEPHQIIEKKFTPEEIVSVEKNPVLNFVSNFRCFIIRDDEEGSLEDKYTIWSRMLSWIARQSYYDKDIIAKNPWVFSRETYINDMGMVRKPKGFFKKCIELASSKEYFEKELNKCE